MKAIRKLGASILAVFMSTAAVDAQSVQLLASQDNTMYESSTGAVSNGKGIYLFTGRTAQAAEVSRRRALIAFNIGASIPSGSTILNAALTLNMSKTATGATDVTLHRVLASWGEGSSDASGQEGSGGPSQPGDATWIHRSSDSTFWASTGGDFVVAPSASTTVIGLGLYTWGSTPQIVADVQGWLDDPGGNHGWVMIGLEAVSTTAKRFDSRENPILALRPTLAVSYAVPVPAISQWGLVCLVILLVSAATIVWSRRRLGRHL